MQKKLLILIILLAQLSFILAQNKDFSGRILYKNKFYAPNGFDITNQVAPSMGVEQDYYINTHNYKSIQNGSAIKMQLYNGATNTYYLILPNNLAQKFDGTTVTDSILSVKQFDSDTLILGRKCKKLVITAVQSITTYFYDPNLKVDKNNFKKHEFGNWNSYLEASKGALPVKYIVQMKMFTWDAEAIKIEEMKLTDKDFELSADIKVTK